jgi:hypothetical protein
MNTTTLTFESDSLFNRYKSDIEGTISCFDRLILFGTFQSIGHPEAMSWELHKQNIRLLDYEKRFANPLRLELKDMIKRIALSESLPIQMVNRNQRKESVVSEILEKRGDRTGIVCILSAMESCRCFHVKKNHKTNYLQLQWSPGKCLHYYIYLMDAEYGLCYLRIPTWAPFRLQFYCNGHDWLERQMRLAGIDFEKIDNSFIHISDYQRAEEIVSSFDASSLHQSLNNIAQRFVSVFSRWGDSLHWSIYQAEWATDIVFKSDTILSPLYHELQQTAIFEVQCSDIYKFMGKRLTTASSQEVSSRLKTLLEGTRIKHTLGSTSIKMYDKQNQVLRIETTTNNVSDFKHHREVRHRDGSTTMKYAPLLKTIYSIGALAEQMHACNKRYISFVSQWKDHTKGRTNLNKICNSNRDEQNRSFRGLNLFQSVDLKFVLSILDGKFTIKGFSNRLLQPLLPEWSPHKISRLLKRFRVLKLIKRAGRTYSYYLTKLGKQVLVASLQLRERIVVPALNN